MQDWRIKYYSDLIITEYNKRLLDKCSNKKFKDSIWINDLYRKEKANYKGLSTIEILKEILKNVKEGKYD